jgi:hypothetical protein
MTILISMIHAINRFETDLIIGADFYGSNIRYLSKPFSNEVTAFRQVYFRGFKSTNMFGHVNTNIRGILPREPKKVKQPSIGKGLSEIYFPECLIRRTFRLQAEATTQNVQLMVLNNMASATMIRHDSHGHDIARFNLSTISWDS